MAGINYMSKVTGHLHSPAFHSGHLPVGTIHKLYFAEHGHPQGKPVIFLHGGPGGSATIEHTVFFDPAVYRVVLLDQRGSGKSTPVAEIRENTTPHLVEDIEALRKHLGIERWALVFGGSWGSTLALAYAQTHPTSCAALMLRGIFAVRKSELANAYASYGVWSQMFPESYRAFIDYLRSTLDQSGRADVVNFDDPDVILNEYYKILCSNDPAVNLPAAQAWNRFEMSASSLLPNESGMNKVDEDATWNLQHSRMEAHYFVNAAFMEDGALLKEENLAKIKDIPCDIVQGRYDVVCPPVTAYELHLGLPRSRLYIIPDAGHTTTEPGIKAKLIELCDELAKK